MSESIHWDVINENFCIWDWNIVTGGVGLSDNTLAILGVDSEAYVPSSDWFHSFLHPEDLPMIMLHLETHLTGNDNQEGVVYRLKNKEGSYVPFRSKGIIVLKSKDGSPGHVIWASERLQPAFYN